MSRSFFEYLGIADMERIHSQIISWIFSPDCQAFNENQKIILLEKTFDLTNVKSIDNIMTESGRIDIIIQTDEHIIVIENKIKSSQHSDQLKRYADFCRQQFNRRPIFYFLTLIGEPVTDSLWSRITYEHFLECLSQVNLQEHPHSIITTEYLNYLKKLINVLRDFKANTHIYDMVFLDGRKKKSEKLNSAYQNEKEKFIADNQLETIFQKCFLNSLALCINKTTSFVGDTRGDALIDFHIKRDIPFRNRKYATIIQLQGNLVKFSFSIYGKNYNKSKKAWIQTVIPIMEKISKDNPFQYKRCNKPKEKAYVSISKKLSKNYWHMNVSELALFIETEIENAHKLTVLLENELYLTEV